MHFLIAAAFLTMAVSASAATNPKPAEAPAQQTSVAASRPAPCSTTRRTSFRSTPSSSTRR